MSHSGCIFLHILLIASTHACAVPAPTAATIAIINGDQVYHKANTEYKDDGATGKIIYYGGMEENVPLKAVSNKVPYPCKTAGEYKVTYELVWPSCQCCGCQSQVREQRRITAQRTVIVCTSKQCLESMHTGLSLSTPGFRCNALLLCCADNSVDVFLIGDQVVRHRQGTPYFECGAIAKLSTFNS